MASSGSAKASPWFLWVHYYDPHAPYEPPPDLADRFKSAPYDGEIAFVDRELGRLFKAIQDRGALERTVVLVTADHGESLGEHGEATHGVFIYDGAELPPAPRLAIAPPTTKTTTAVMIRTRFTGRSA